MAVTYQGVISGVRSKTGPSGMIMTHFNLRTPDGQNRHIVAMREGRNKCRGVEAVRDGIGAEISGTWSTNPGRNTVFFASSLVVKAVPAPPERPVEVCTADNAPCEPSEDLWWDWDTIKDAS